MEERLKQYGLIAYLEVLFTAILYERLDNFRHTSGQEPPLEKFQLICYFVNKL
jgi:hypothetical protein